jgi:hypothetical protein
MQIGTSQNISDLIKITLKNWHDVPNNRTQQIDYRGKRELLPVINLRTDQVILNHRNNRLTAQLLDLPEGQELIENPHSVKTQEKLAELLASTEKFKDLKLELEHDGQKEPGLITRSGLLVNGNTRAAALLQLSHLNKAKGIDVAVLPAGVVEDDIIELEMSLQMKRQTHQDYSFTNELLFMRKYLDRGKAEKELAATMGWIKRGEPKVRTHMRILDIIEATRNFSNNKSLSYEVFDRKKEHLADLDRVIETMKNDGNLTGAEQIKNSRILGILLNLSKDQVRIIDDKFISEDLFTKREAGGNSNLYHFLNKYKNNVNEPKDDLSGLLDEEPVYKIDSSRLLKSFLSNPDNVNEYGDLNDDLSGDFYELQKEMSEIARGKIDRKVQETQAQKMHTIIRSITDNIINVRDRVPEELNDKLFKKDQFEYELNKAKKELENLFETYKNSSSS